MRTLSGRERLLRVFRQQPTDRMPICLPSVDPMFSSTRSSWKPLYELVNKYELDIIRGWYPKPRSDLESALVEIWTPSGARLSRRECNKPGVWKYESVMSTPQGDLAQISYQPEDGSPGYVKKHFVETVEDMQKWISLPSCTIEPYYDPHSYFDLLRKTGDRALLHVSIDEVLGTMWRLMGSETFGFWLKEKRSYLHELAEHSYATIENLVKYLLFHNLGDCYAWAGSEFCIPPLASPRDFREFVFDYDKRIIDLIHDAGKLVSVHSHGDMKPVLLDFVEMGVDCLNPIEPPPVGGLTLKEAKKLVNGRMTLLGGVPNSCFDLLQPKEMEKLLEETVAMGKPGGCYIFSETSNPMTWSILTEKHIANYKAFIETGVRLASYD